MRIVELARRWFVPLSLAALAVLFVVRARAGAELRPARSPGSSAPVFTLPDLQQQPVSLTAFRGRPVLLNFFATWCPPCRAELPDLEALAQANPDCLRVVGIAVNSGAAAKVAAFARERGLTYPVLMDDGGAGAKYSVARLPHSVLIDADGGLVGTFDGMVTKEGVMKAVRALDKPSPRC